MQMLMMTIQVSHLPGSPAHLAQPPLLALPLLPSCLGQSPLRRWAALALTMKPSGNMKLTQLAQASHRVAAAAIMIMHACCVRCAVTAASSSSSQLPRSKSSQAVGSSGFDDEIIRLYETDSTGSQGRPLDSSCCNHDHACMLCKLCCHCSLILFFPAAKVEVLSRCWQLWL